MLKRDPFFSPAFTAACPNIASQLQEKNLCVVVRLGSRGRPLGGGLGGGNEHLVWVAA